MLLKYSKVDGFILMVKVFIIPQYILEGYVVLMGLSGELLIQISYKKEIIDIRFKLIKSIRIYQGTEIHFVVNSLGWLLLLKNTIN